MTRGYSAASPAAFGKGPKAAAMRSSKPGFVGAKGRNTSRGIPSDSAARRISARRVRNSTTWNVSPPKSSVLTDQAHSSGVGVRASPSLSISGLYLWRAMVPYLTLIGFSQRDDSNSAFTVSEDANVQTSIEKGDARYSDFAIGMARVNHVDANCPVQPRRIGQRQPVLFPVRRVLRLIPFERHASEVMRGVVNQPFHGGQA
jgi:hypothetical protein